MNDYNADSKADSKVDSEMTGHDSAMNNGGLTLFGAHLY